MKKSCIAFATALIVSVSVFGQSADPSLTAYASVGFPTAVGIGAYYPFTFFDPASGILQGAELSASFGTNLNQPALFAGAQDELTAAAGGGYKYKGYPSDGLKSGPGTLISLRAYINAYELDLPFGRLPLSAGLYFGFGGGGGDETYISFDSAFLLKAEAKLKAFTLLTPYIELGFGGGSGTPSNAAAKTKIAGGDYSMEADQFSENYAKYFMSGFDYFALVLNLGVRYDLPLNFLKPKPKASSGAAGSSTDAGASGNNAATANAAGEAVVPEGEAAAEQTTQAVKDTRISEFLFPVWLNELGGLTHSPDPMNFMAGNYILGVENFFGKYSFKYQSSYKGDSFTYKYDKTGIIQIIQADDEIYHAILKDKAGVEKEYKLYRLKKGSAITIDGTEINPDEDGVYMDGKIFTRIAPSSM